MASLDEKDDHDDVMMMLRKTSLKGCPIADICSNTERVVMATFDGRVYTCDVADSGTQDNYVEVDFPTFARDHAINIVSVCCGRHHFLALSTDGQVYSWGRNTEGQLGRPKKKRKHKKQNLSSQDLTPRLITGLSDYYVIQIACGDDHSLALTRDGRLFSWGSNTHSQLGVDTQGKKAKHHVDKPMEIKALRGVPLQHIAAGGDHSVVLSTSVSVFVWGRNSHGQLGLQQKEDVKQPVKLGYMSQEKVKDISCGTNHTSFLKEDGKLLVYGIGAGRFPYDVDMFEQWNESELRPWQPDRFQTFSSIRSTSRCTYLVDEINGSLYVLNHDKVEQNGPSRNLQINPPDGRLFVDLLEPDSLTTWPPGNYAFDTSVWEQSNSNEGVVTTYRERCRESVAEVEQSLEQASMCRQSSSEGRGKLLKESLSTTPSPGSDRTQTRSNSMPSETVIQHSKTQLVNGVALHSFDHAANPTAATMSNTIPHNMDTALTSVSVNDGSALHDGNLFSLEEAESDMVAAVGASSGTEYECSEEKALGHGRDTDDGQETNSSRTLRRWRRICAGQEHIFVIEHEESETK